MRLLQFILSLVFPIDDRYDRTINHNPRWMDETERWFRVNHPDLR